MPPIRVAIAGATGYAGEELVRLLLQHPHVQLTYLAASAKWDRPSLLSDVFPRFAGAVSAPVEALDPKKLLSLSDAVFLALPHGGAMELLPDLLNAGKRVVDLSGDFRLRDPQLYPQWYKLTHAHPELLGSPQVVYGLTEYHREAIAKASAIANPGCYATSILLAILPLLQDGLIEDRQFVVDAKSGLTGAGRKAETSLLFTEIAENLRAYKVNQHQHMPEVLQEIAAVSGAKALMSFVPQVIPIRRGLISMIYARTGAGESRIREAFAKRYTPERTPFVRLRAAGTLPQVQDVTGTNYCDIGFTYDAEQRQLIVVSAIDNLTKGAAGQAIQNFNVMHGFPETMGLL